MPEKRFACNFDALEIEAHGIVCNEDASGHRYEPWDFDSDGAVPDVWSVFGHSPNVGRRFIADCETAEAAEFITELVATYIRNKYYRNEYDVKVGKVLIPEVPVYWITDKP